MGDAPPHPYARESLTDDDVAGLLWLHPTGEWSEGAPAVVQEALRRFPELAESQVSVVNGQPRVLWRATSYGVAVRYSLDPALFWPDAHSSED